MLFANCTFRHILRLFRLLRGDRSGIDKSSSATCLLYSNVVKGDPSLTWLRKYQEEDEEEAVKRAIKESEVFVSWYFTTFFYLFFLNYCVLSFFSILFVPTTFTHTHDPRPTAFSYTRSGLARRGWSGLVGLGLISSCSNGLIWLVGRGWAELGGLGLSWTCWTGLLWTW